MKGKWWQRDRVWMEMELLCTEAHVWVPPEHYAKANASQKASKNSEMAAGRKAK
jgi:hypothetical protein